VAGNVRELINVVERAVLLSSGAEILLSDLPLEIRAAPTSDPRQDPRPVDPEEPAPAQLPWREARERASRAFERSYFSALLRETGGRVAETARRAAIDPRSLFSKLRRLGLRKEDFRSQPGTRAESAAT
jgi:DNA-binding NtrC family response regulator